MYNMSGERAKRVEAVEMTVGFGAWDVGGVQSLFATNIYIFIFSHVLASLSFFLAGLTKKIEVQKRQASGLPLCMICP